MGPIGRVKWPLGFPFSSCGLLAPDVWFSLAQTNGRCKFSATFHQKFFGNVGVEN